MATLKYDPASYFKQGHEINFLQARDWIVNNLATVGAKCRGNFMHEIIELFSCREVPAAVKMAWNDCIKEIVNE